MKLLDEIFGFIEYENAAHPFYFNKDEFILHLFPPTIEKWKESRANFWQGLKEKSRIKDEWIGNHDLKGFTSQGYSIQFNVQDLSGNRDGFEDFHVNWVWYYSGDYAPDSIKGFMLSGGDIDIFYSPAKAFDGNYALDERKFKITAEMVHGYLNCGSYDIKPDLKAELMINAFAEYHPDGNKPLDAHSRLKVEFNRGVELKEVIRAIEDIDLFLCYACYRTNIVYEGIETFWINRERKAHFAGRLLFPENYEKEHNEDAKHSVIPFDFWKERMGDMLAVINDRQLELQYLCEDIDGTRSYPVARFIMILTAFEREYRNIYGNDANRSPEYKNVKEEVVNYLKELASSRSGDAKTYIRGFSKFINKLDDSYEQRVKYALDDCMDIMTPFIAKYYPDASEMQEKIIIGISKRMGRLRNDLAHSNLDAEITPVNLSDIKMMEELIYAMRLKYMGFEPDGIRKAIGRLFGDVVT